MVERQLIGLVHHMHELLLLQLLLKGTVLPSLLLLHPALLFLQRLNLLQLQTFIHVVTQQQPYLYPQFLYDEDEAFLMQDAEVQFHHFLGQQLRVGQLQGNDLNVLIDIYDL